jgi:four helix bundle protein
MAGVTRFEDFDAWKLSVELRDLVYRMCDGGPVLKDHRFRDQIRDSAAGPPRNISEGFGRFEPNEFANYMRFAKASLMETQNHLRHGRKQKYFSEEDFQKALRLSKRALGASRGLHRYLRSCKGRLPWETKKKEPEPEPEPEPKEPRGTPEPPEPP